MIAAFLVLVLADPSPGLRPPSPRATGRGATTSPSPRIRGEGARRADEGHGVNLDVKDENIRNILKSMGKQCEIRNLIIHPSVNGNGTFVFHDVPCKTAFDTVATMMSLRVEFEENDVVTVRPQ